MRIDGENGEPNGKIHEKGKGKKLKSSFNFPLVTVEINVERVVLKNTFFSPSFFFKEKKMFPSF